MSPSSRFLQGESLTECGLHCSLASAIYPQKPLQNSVT